MQYDSRIHRRVDFIKSLMWKISGWLPRMTSSKDDLLVLNYHGTPKSYIKNFEVQLKFLLDNYRVISPADLQAYFEDKLEDGDRPCVLLNFDDGINNNLYAVELMEKYKICAFFFIVPQFINRPLHLQSVYFREKIRGHINPYITKNREDKTAMSWQDLKDLIKLGHEVGSHSATHTLTVDNSTLASRKYEIVESRHMIAKTLNLKVAEVRAFCGPRDSMLSVGSLEMALIKQNYNFFFASFAGSNYLPKNPYFIKRINMEIYWLLDTVKFSLSNLNRLRWNGRVKSFEKILK